MSNPTPTQDAPHSKPEVSPKVEAAAQASRQEIKAAEQQEAKTNLKTTDGYILDKAGQVANRPVEPLPYRQNQARFGFTPYAEILNGRAAMVGFAIAIAIELVSGQGVLHFWGIL